MGGGEKGVGWEREREREREEKSERETNMPAVLASIHERIRRKEHQ